MSTRVVDRVDEWSERSFADGHRSLHEFADEEFSGVVRAGGAELYMTKGTVVGVRHGSIEDFADATGTAYESPSPALPLLAVMQETSDEVRAEYYSEKTSIAEVDSTLTDGSFTGYIELSDNVLSGDYYLVYHAGRSMSVGFVGSSSRLIDGDEAFDTADDEVGIYQVRPADIEVVEIPETESSTDEAASSPADGGARDGSEPPATGEPDAEDTDNEPADSGPPAEDGTAARESEPAGADDEPADVEAGGADDDGSADRPAEPPQASADRTEAAGRTEGATADRQASADRTETSRRNDGATADRQASPDGTETSGRSEGATADRQASAEQPGTRTREPTPGTAGVGEQAGTAPDAGGQREQPRPDAPRRSRDRGEREQSTQAAETPEPDLAVETRAIPSLDPERTSEPDESGGSARADTFGRTQGQPPARANAAGTAARPAGQESTPPEPEAPAETTRTTGETASGGEQTAGSERIEELESKLDERNEEIRQLEAELDRKTTEYEDAKAQLESLREERDELASEVERLESELDRLETQFGAATDAERRMTPAEALAGTDIFPRYESKGDATLEKAHDGSHRREDVLGNLRIEKNTQFDADAVSVGSQTYDEFLESTLEYRFVDWVVGNLLFEIRETGHEKALKDLYDALPVIDWADLKGTVDVEYTEDGQETRSQESFDVVLRNRMGEPLVVANVNDSRQGATESMMETLVRSAERVGQSSEVFAGAFLVTRSFFEPPALETADDATRGGLLSRNKRKSFVNLSRKQGYHLCLVEARNENFTLLVPEL